jgi:DNA polymerase III epsilon subunit-like protein
MKTLIFDTETTGLANFRLPLETQPHPVQIAAILRVDKKIYAQFNLITITEVESHPKALETHGMDMLFTQTYGVALEVAVDLFLQLLYQADRIVCHNSDFDRTIMAAAIMRATPGSNTHVHNFLKKPHICTMYSSMPVLKLPGRYGNYKWPKLEEAYRYLVDPHGFEGAHDALQDVLACAAVLDVLEADGTPMVGGKY